MFDSQLIIQWSHLIKCISTNDIIKSHLPYRLFTPVLRLKHSGTHFFIKALFIYFFLQYYVAGKHPPQVIQYETGQRDSGTRFFNLDDVIFSRPCLAGVAAFHMARP